MPEITTRFLPPMPPGAGKDAALKGVPQPPRFRGGGPHPPGPELGEGGEKRKAPVSSAPRPPAAGEGHGEGAEKLRDATQQFEAFFVAYLMKQMRKGVGEGQGILAPSEGEKVFRDMMDDETARSASATGQMGIADLLYNQLAPALRGEQGKGQR